MRKSFYAAMALVAGACFFGAACDDEDTTTPTGSGSGSGSTTGTQTGTSTGCDDPVDSECIQSCEDLYACIQEEDVQCPGLQGTAEEDYLCGTTSDGCFAQCDANPALKAVVDSSDCAGTVGTLLGLNQTFAAACEAGGGGGGTGGGGTGGGATGGGGGATGGGGGGA